MTRAPNIVLVQSDDHARWALPVYGNDRFHAPNISALAARGIVMDQAFTPTPVCSPARASTMTGLMPSQHGIRDFISSLPEFHDLDRMAGLDTLPQLLGRAGYHCGLAGKWHLGRDRNPAAGFDEWRALSGAYPILHQGTHSFSINGEISLIPGALNSVITDQALDVMAQRPEDKPFFLYVGYYATHSPWSDHPAEFVPEDEPLTPLEEVPEGYQPLNVELRDATPEAQQSARAQYRAAVAEIDADLGRILEALPPEEDTIIVYTSDHGLSLGAQGLFGKGNATYPQNLFDDHIRIPMILSRPGIWPEGERSSALVDLTDLYATLCQAAGVAWQERDGHKRPGCDILSVVEGKTEAKTSQVCEYGPLALLHDGKSGTEVTPEATPSSDAMPTIAEFYKALDCAPPWQWVPPEQYVFNPTDAWKPPRS